jgi:PmbA protein
VPADPAVDLGLQIVADAKVQGGEVYFEDHTVFSAVVAEGRVESIETQESRGVGVRLFEHGRVAFSYTSDLSEGGLREAVSIARSLLPLADADEANSIPEADESSTPDPETYDPALVRVDPQEKIRVAKRVERAPRSPGSSACARAATPTSWDAWRWPTPAGCVTPGPSPASTLPSS